jgi:glycyl-tRNA synthetase
MSKAPTLDQIVSLSKRRGFVYQTSEIYGGLANSYDYGPMGSELLRNIKNLWWREFIQKRADMFGIDSQILLHPKTWEASGHTTSLTDPLVEDKVTHKRFRADHLIEEFIKDKEDFKNLSVEEMDLKTIAEFIEKNNLKSPDGNDITPPMDFNLLFETSIGAVAGEKAKAYLRGETAQGIFTNFKNILDSTRAKLPFGIAHMNRSFRNEITTGQFIFRTLEFEQGEIEYFFNPKEQNWQDLFKTWQADMMSFCVNTLGINKENLRWRRHPDAERSFYSKDTYDLEYKFPFGWKELWGIAYRTDYDLKQHMEHSGVSMEYLDPNTGERFIPHVIEPAVGINRLVLMALCDGFDQQDQKLVLKLKPDLAPYLAAVFPLVKNKPELTNQAKEIYQTLASKFNVAWDDRGNIGKRYLSQDEIGTPFCITVDYQTLEDQTVTLRDRDTAEQKRIRIEDLEIELSNVLR